MKVLVTDAGSNHALALTRSLGSKGIEVTACDDNRFAKSFYSRFCSDSFVYPSPRVSASRFADNIIARLNRGPYSAVFPMTERAILPLSERRDHIAPAVHMPIPSHESILKAFNKSVIVDLAVQLQIPVPKTIAVHTAEQLADAANQLGLPVVMKASTSERTTEDDRIVATPKPRYIFRMQDLESHFRDFQSADQPVLLQEFVPGEGYGIFALFNQGAPRAWFAHRRLRDVIATGSGSAFRESIPLDPEMTASSHTLLKALNWHGVAMVEFRLDHRDHVPKLMEVNGRFWNSLPLAIASGVDFPFLLHRMALEGDIEPLNTYRVGVRCRWLLGDLRHLVSVLKGPPKGWRESFPTRWHTFQDVVRGFHPSVYDDDFVRGDLTPGIMGFVDFLANKVPASFLSHRRVYVGR